MCSKQSANPWVRAIKHKKEVVKTSFCDPLGARNRFSETLSQSESTERTLGFEPTRTKKEVIKTSFL